MTLWYVHAFYASAKKREEVHMNVPAPTPRAAFELVRSKFESDVIVEAIKPLFEIDEPQVN